MSYSLVDKPGGNSVKYPPLILTETALASRLWLLRSAFWLCDGRSRGRPAAVSDSTVDSPFLDYGCHIVSFSSSYQLHEHFSAKIQQILPREKTVLQLGAHELCLRIVKYCIRQRQ